MRLLDSDIVIDILRGHAPALRWIVNVRGDELLVPGHVVMELIRGARNRQERDRVLQATEQWPLLWPTAEDCNRALTDFAIYYLSHNLSATDALIGQTAIGADAILCTFNVRHFRLIRDLVTEQPYDR
jgi:predicted nucleic acid-binding protein